jgi:hypothetical protein
VRKKKEESEEEGKERYYYLKLMIVKINYIALPHSALLSSSIVRKKKQ